MLVSAQEEAAKKNLKSAETKSRALKEEMLKLKSSVQQIRGQCANEIRRRDGEISKLKRHLTGRRHRDGNGGQAGVVVITPMAKKAQQRVKPLDGEVDLASSQYTLGQETTEFLTQLSQGLSDENDALIGLVKSTLNTLRNLQGLPLDPILNSAGFDETASNEFANAIMMAPPSYEVLAASANEVLTHVQTLLTNPSFVPIEELELREDEIARLREGWEKMEIRWKEAVALMDGWRKRMLNTGDTINLEDIKMGMKLGVGLPEVPSTQHGSQIHQAEKDDLPSDSVLFEGLREPSSQESRSGDGECGESSRDAEEPLEEKFLRNGSGNARRSLLPRKVSFISSIEEVPKSNEDLENELYFGLPDIEEKDVLDRSATSSPEKVMRFTQYSHNS